MNNLSGSFSRIPHRSIGSFCVCMAALALFSYPSLARGQFTQLNASTATPTPGLGHDYLQGLSETVDPSSGALSLRIKVAEPAGRQLNLPFYFAYDSNGVYVPEWLPTGATWSDLGLFGGSAPDYGSLQWLSGAAPVMSSGGWTYTLPMSGGPVEISHPSNVNNGGPTPPPCNTASNWGFFDPNGGRHNFGIVSLLAGAGYPTTCEQLSITEMDYGGDLTYGASVPQGAAYAGNGMIVSDFHGVQYSFAGGDGIFPTKVEDRNGNIVQIADTRTNGQVTRVTETDTLGRSVLSVSGFGATGNTVTVAGVAEPYTLSWETANYNFDPQAQVAFNPDGGCGMGNAQGSQPAIQSIMIPDGQQYVFQYDPVYGLLDKLTYPTGATVTYTWGTSPLAASIKYPDHDGALGGCIDLYGKPAVAKRVVSFDGTTPALEQDFSYATNWSTAPGDAGLWTSKQTTVVTKDLIRGTTFTTMYTYSPTSSGDPTELTSTAYDVDSQYPVESTVAYQDTNGSTIKTETKTWQNAQQMSSEKDTENGASTSETAYQYYGNTTLIQEEDDYDFGQGAPGGVLRTTVTTYQQFPNYRVIDDPCKVVVSNANGEVAETDYLYDGGTSVCGAPGAPSVTGASNLPAGTHDETNYGPGSTASRGNATSIIRKCLQGCSDSVTQYAYDETGQALTATDAKGNQTTADYQCSDAFLNRVTNALGQATQYSYDCNTSLLSSVQDANDLANGRPGTQYSYDGIGDLISTSYPDGGSMTVNYNGYANPLTVTTTTAAAPDPAIVQTVVDDGLGRVLSETLPSGAVEATAYDGQGRVYTVTDPHSTSDSGYGSTVYGYDALGRKTSAAHTADGTAETWTYTGNAVDNYDETGRHWTRLFDGLGRLTTVLEPNGSNVPSIETDYSYDALGNLWSVNQKGVSGETAEGRNFVYNSLSQLMEDCNPEAIGGGSTCSSSGPWSDTYTYDVNGNLSSKTDARGVDILYCYDQLDRLLSKSTADTSCPGNQPSPNAYAGYVYDTSASYGFSGVNQIGRLAISASSGGAGSIYSYDPMGRIALQVNATPSAPTASANEIQAVYDQAGSLSQLTYPDGRVIKQAFNGAGQITQSAFQTYNGQGPASSYNYLASASYWPNGAVNTMTFGNGAVETQTLNSRLQTAEIKVTGAPPGIAPPTLADRSYAYTYTSGCANTGQTSPQADNSDILQINDALNGARSESLCYDNLNRMTFASIADSSLQQTNTYDSFGNITGSTGTVNFTPTGGPNNRILDSAHYQYDSAGNLTQANPGILSTYSYDAENRVAGFNNGAATYIYDGEGNRVRKNVGSDWTEYIYWNGQTLAEKHADGSWSDYIFANGQRIARADNYDTRLHMSGVNAESCSGEYFSLGIIALSPYTHVIQPGDILNFRQYSSGPGALGGLALYMSSDFISYFAPVYDTDGQDIGADTTMDAWHYRTIDLTPYAGYSLGFVRLINTGGAPAGQFDLYFDDISVTSPDGTVLPVFSKTPGVYVEGGIDGPAGCVSNFNVVDETSATAQDALTPENTTTYYHGDQIGSARLLTAGGGWAVWSGVYTPYGQEINPAEINPPNFYKFTGKDRDEEEGSYLDYFGARYYSSMMGRFMSPDALNGHVEDPQTLNKYSYVGNDPLSRTDPTGMDPTGMDFYTGCAVETANACRSVSGSGGDTVVDLKPVTFQVNVWATPLFDPFDFSYVSLPSELTAAGGNHRPFALAPSKNCQTGFGVGVVGGADAGAGVGPGAFATGSGGGAVLFNGFHLPNFAGFLTGGLGAGSHGYPSQSNGSVAAGGAGAAAGGGLFFTNATNASQLSGPALTFSGGVDVGVGLGISVSFGTDAAGHTIWTGTVTGGYGLKVYGYAGTTQTKAGGTGPKC